jgi:hypothetical protein
MRVKYRFSIIGVLILTAMAVAAFSPSTDKSVSAATLTAASQPNLDPLTLPSFVQHPIRTVPSQLAYSPRRPIGGVAQNCIAKGQTCVLNGTPCCAGTSCQGNFPNTYCQ